MFDFSILDMNRTDTALLSNDWPNKIYNMVSLNIRNNGHNRMSIKTDYMINNKENTTLLGL